MSEEAKNKPDAGRDVVQERLIHEQKELQELMELYKGMPFWQMLKKVASGLRSPKDSGDYRYARLQITRLWAPFLAILLPALAVVVMAIFSVMEKKQDRAYEVKILDPEEMTQEKLEEIKELLKEEVEQPDTEMEMAADTPMDTPSEDVVAPNAEEFSPQPAQMDSVIMTKSPVVMRGIYGARTGGARGSALGRYGGKHGGSAEKSVMLALRWLKRYQERDGRWQESSGNGPVKYGGASVAMTSLALLTYLAHGETPASPEFGPTVEKAIQWLIASQRPDGKFKNTGGEDKDYSQPIAAYALCETYALTKVPMVKVAAEKAIDIIIKGQNPGGLWNYNFGTSGEGAVHGKDRNDISFGGWCAQALKAASGAGLENPGLKEAIGKAVTGLKGNYRTDMKGFAYTQGDEANESSSSIGALCMQLLGMGKDPAVKDAMSVLDAATCDWKTPAVDNPIYTWYYLTQAKFHTGGSVWDSWNNKFAPQLTGNQTIIKNGIKDLKGNNVDIGYWKPCNSRDKPTIGAKGEHCQSYVYNTTLSALMLTVYYRYLPTYQAPKDLGEDIAIGGGNDDIDVTVR
jgi:hypothetical protein